MKDIFDRIEYLVEKETNGNSEKFGELVGVTGQTIRNVSKFKRNKPNLDLITKILQNFVWLSPDWLLLGKGSIHRKECSPDNDTSNTSPEWLLKRIEELAIENNDLKKEICRLTSSKKNNLQNTTAEHDI